MDHDHIVVHQYPENLEVVQEKLVDQKDLVRKVKLLNVIVVVVALMSRKEVDLMFQKEVDRMLRKEVDLTHPNEVALVLHSDLVVERQKIVVEVALMFHAKVILKHLEDQDHKALQEIQAQKLLRNVREMYFQTLTLMKQSQNKKR